MMKTVLFPILGIMLLSISACKKKPSAGTGGNANLKISAFHHTSLIDSCTIYVKFNSSEAPANNVYDLTQKVAVDSVGDSYAIFSGLKKGDYYLFAQGWDPAISDNVKGGLPYTISEETDISVVIPVTEVH